MNPPVADGSALVRIAVIDDHPFFCEGILAWIERQQTFTVCGQAASPADALAVIAAQKPDVVLLDLQLKGGDGFEVLRALQAGGHPARAIVVSQKDEFIFAERALRAGARGYVLKDEACETLRAAIVTVLDGGIHLSEAVRRHLTHSPVDGSETPVERLGRLSRRELQVMRLLGRGYATKQIAHELGLSPKTVEFYRESLKSKLGLPDSLMLVRLATIWEYEGRLEP